MECENCLDTIKLGKVWWVHHTTNDTWCYPMSNQFATEYVVAKPKELV